MSLHRDRVFVAGGEPTVTYVRREELHIERTLSRAIASPNHVVSLSGPTKTGKTVLCRKVLGEREYVWIEGGQIKSPEALWERVCAELNIPAETKQTEGEDYAIKADVNAVVVTAGGSRLSKVSKDTIRKVHSMADALKRLLEGHISLVIDDFHYLDEETRTAVMRNVKGAVFNGLKVVLLSVTHRTFDAIRAETELTGRFSAITLPGWSSDDLLQIPILGFEALGVRYERQLIETLAAEAQESPFLMQKFCWEICFDLDIQHPSGLFSRHIVPGDYDLEAMFVRLAQDAGLPVYQKLVAGPQSRKVRTRRPLSSGEDADIYEAILLGIAATGPKSAISYDELRTRLTSMLTDRMPQKHEITSALKHLVKIGGEIGTDTVIDWDEDKREVTVADPYLRFFLRWQVRERNNRPASA